MIFPHGRQLDPGDLRHRLRKEPMSSVISARPATRWRFRLQFVLVVMATCHVTTSEAGSRMIEPPARPSLWRYGFGTPVDFDDDEINCGGYDRHHGLNRGRCGVCGDPWDQTPPRKYEAGNVTTVNPRPVRVYRMGGDIPVAIESSARLAGRYEFRLCKVNSSDNTPPQACFDATRLSIRESELGRAYRIGQSGGLVSLHLVLPATLTCNHCILQWRHVTGNRWNRQGCVRCGTEPPQCNYCQGCGQQTWFQTCSDIAIYDTVGSHPALRGLRTQQEVKQMWEETLRSLRGNCSCVGNNNNNNNNNNPSFNSIINSSSPSPDSTTVDLSPLSVTTTITTTTTTKVPAPPSKPGSNGPATGIAVPPVDGWGTGWGSSFTTTPATLTTTKHPYNQMPLFNFYWVRVPPTTTPTTTTTRRPPPIRVCYVPYRPPWYLFDPRSWCLRNCPRSGPTCRYQVCRPVTCPYRRPSPPQPPSRRPYNNYNNNGNRNTNNRIRWVLPVLFPEMFEL